MQLDAAVKAHHECQGPQHDQQRGQVADVAEELDVPNGEAGGQKYNGRAKVGQERTLIGQKRPFDGQLISARETGDGRRECHSKLA